MATFDCSSVALDKLLLDLWRYAKVQHSLDSEDEYEEPTDPSQYEIELFIQNDYEIFCGCYIGVYFGNPKAVSTTNYDREYGDGAFERIFSSLPNN